MTYLFMVDIEGTEISALENKIIQHKNAGAIILFTRNFQNPEQFKTLTNQIHTLNPNIFIATDQEGGNVQRFQYFGIRALPAPRILGEIYDADSKTALQMAKYYGKIMAQDLLNLGVDLHLGPLIDLHGNNAVIGKLDRALHSDPEIVEILAEAWIEGAHEEKMPSVCKHFPGHGLCQSDSHLTITIDESTDHAINMQLKPFLGLIKKNKADSIMPAHIIYKNIDAKNTAGFSKIWLQDRLRSEYGFEGLIISDCLSMKGADVGDMPTRALRALRAGCDMLIMCNQSREMTLQVLNSIDFESSQESIHRLALFKKKMHRFS